MRNSGTDPRLVVDIFSDHILAANHFHLHAHALQIWVTLISAWLARLAQRRQVVAYVLRRIEFIKPMIISPSEGDVNVSQAKQQLWYTRKAPHSVSHTLRTCIGLVPLNMIIFMRKLSYHALRESVEVIFTVSDFQNWTSRNLETEALMPSASPTQSPSPLTSYLK